MQDLLKVMIVDDEEKIRNLLSYSLRKQALDVTSAGSGHDALELMGQQSIDILITDVRMPEMDGLDLARRVRKQYPDVQIIIISAHSDIDSALEALKVGAVDFLRKPLDPKVLLLAINSSAEKIRLQRELKEAYDSLEQEKEFLAVTLRSIGDGVIASDLEGRVSMMNKVAAELTGWAADQALGQPLSKVFHIINEQTQEVCENPAAQALKTGLIIGLANHTALIARDGTLRSIADSGAAIRDRDSKIIGSVLVFRDVTLANRIDDELAKTKKLDSIGVLAGGIAHDFNNILTGIMGNINISKGLIDPASRAYKFLDAAEKASERASKLTQQLLTFSKGGEPILELASIFEVIQESANFTLSGANISCRIDRDNDLWAASIDKGQISQVVQNIVLNARHAMPEGGTIRILCENVVLLEGSNVVPLLKSGDYIRIDIEDEGVGIAENQIDKIFDPYFTTKHEGSGLGMAVTHSIIHKHSGHISCQSSLGEGTKFTIYLPAVKTALLVADDNRETLEGSGTILVMDDETMIREVTQSMLEVGGYDVVHAVDGDQALAVYGEAMKCGQAIKLVIMDLTIPGGMGGRDTIKKLLDIDPQVCALVSSGYSNDPVIANYQDYGFKGFIIKPYLSSDLLRAVGKAISSL
ncbi:hypothetical protein A9Q89_06095 [Gammaproteobacteria bacterium 53_120_T64]|nr:hypothetical protein A9Q89_06095 [Gammaproteobacteria bacterium 53_120_T64]